MALALTAVTAAEFAASGKVHVAVPETGSCCSADTLPHLLHSCFGDCMRFLHTSMRPCRWDQIVEDTFTQTSSASLSSTTHCLSTLTSSALSVQLQGGVTQPSNHESARVKLPVDALSLKRGKQSCRTVRLGQTCDAQCSSCPCRCQAASSEDLQASEVLCLGPQGV